MRVSAWYDGSNDPIHLPVFLLLRYCIHTTVSGVCDRDSSVQDSVAWVCRDGEQIFYGLLPPHRRFVVMESNIFVG